MSTLCSPLTLYKPYLLYMYDIQQFVQSLKKNPQTCLVRGIEQTKYGHLNMNEAKLLQHVIKYNLPSSIEGSPRCHKSQPQDMLAMVETFGRPHFFLTWPLMRQALYKVKKNAFYWCKKLMPHWHGKTVLLNVCPHFMLDFRKFWIGTLYQVHVYLVVSKNMCFDMK